ncbi:penicillin-binding protein 2 [Lachnospiraceae bacterium G11]|nr:penicillin-binding protein 2 [Lachnospiraceae bacterium G11]
MFERIKENLINLFTSRFLFLYVAFFAMMVVLLIRVFDLQIIHGEEYLDDFMLKAEKSREIPSTRGNIYDRNGVLLAYSELAYTVKIEDVYEGGSRARNQKMNDIIFRVIKMIEKNGDNIVNDFNIAVENGEYKYTLSGSLLQRFKADVYGHAYVTDMTYQEETSTAEEMMEFLMSTKKYGVGTYLDENDSKSFQPGLGYSKEEALKIVNIRYNLGLIYYQKYLGTTIASDVSPETVAAIMENLDDLEGISIEEDTARRYVDSVYFSPIIGYTGSVSTEELDALNLQNKEKTGVDADRYELNDIVGKTGIEQTMELELQGNKGSEQVYVDNVGKVVEVKSRIEPTAGNDVYLTIDHDLQIAVYNILEQNIAGILLSKLRNMKTFTPTERTQGADMVVPIYDVYYALFNNYILDTAHFEEEYAGENEKNLYQKHTDYKNSVIETINVELTERRTPYNRLKTEFQVYESNIVSYLTDDGVIISDQIDTKNPTYDAWKTQETIGLGEYLEWLISINAIDISKLSLDDKYSDSAEIFNSLCTYIRNMLDEHVEFNRKLYKYMLLGDVIYPADVCKALCEQGNINIDPDAEEKLFSGRLSSYDFICGRIEKLEITPAKLALDPCCGSMVITDVNNGDVLALVSYPGYDNNRLVNTVDKEYYASLQLDRSKPMYNYATQQETAPGSTFKMVMATAGLMEGTINTSTTFPCYGPFEKANYVAKCWISPGAHGLLNVVGAIQNSCNNFFYELGYRLSIDEDGDYNSPLGLSKIYKYADMYGLSEKSGVEIEEAEPMVSDELSVLSAIGQGTNNYTTVGLARYVTTVANSGTCYNLTLIDKVTDHNNALLYDNSAEVRNLVEMPDNYWNAIHTGMRKVVETKYYYSNLGVNVAGKTGTAQESKSRTNHALFICYAPYESPEIAIATRIAYGYSSDFAARTTREAIKYYFKLDDEDTIVSGTADSIESGIGSNEG